jgi:putative ABC transport system substrate-binding protein
MQRREFIRLLGGAAAAWPLTTRAQQQGKLPTIGLLGATTAPLWSRWLAAFVKRLRELGWMEGRTVVIEYRWAEGRSERFAEIAAEFVRIKVDVIVTAGTAVPFVKQATTDIPIIFPMANDPVGAGLVASLARPGGNVTGVSLQAHDLAGKRVEILREILPGLQRIAVIANAGYSAAVQEMNEIETIARTVDIEVSRLKIRRAEEIEQAIEAVKGNAGALYACADSLVLTNLVRINTAALAARLPTMNFTREFVEAGGLVSYGPNYVDLFRRGAELVDKVLHGEKPADIPVEQPTKFELVVNLITARALGLTVPQMLLARADEVIE